MAEHQIFSAWAVEQYDKIDVRTVSPTRRAAIVNWLVAGEGNPEHMMIFAYDTDAHIEQMWEYRSQRYSAQVIEVQVLRKPAA